MKTEKQNITYVNIEQLEAATYNPRKINQTQLDQLITSIKEFGVVEPIVVNTFKGRENIIVGGHQRVKAMQSLGYKEVPCIFVSLPIEKEKELNVRLNKNQGEFDLEILLTEFATENLLEWGFEEIELNIADELDFEPVEDDTKLDEVSYYEVACPSCNHGFMVDGKGKIKNS